MAETPLNLILEEPIPSLILGAQWPKIVFSFRQTGFADEACISKILKYGTTQIFPESIFARFIVWEHYIPQEDLGIYVGIGIDIGINNYATILILQYDFHRV